MLLSELNFTHCTQEASWFQHLSAPLQDLLGSVLTVDPSQRITADAIASHPWLAQAQAAPSPPPVVGGAQLSSDEETTARDWSTFWPDAETASAGAAGAGAASVGLPTTFSFGSDDSWDGMGAYHAGFVRRLCCESYVV